MAGEERECGGDSCMPGIDMARMDKIFLGQSDVEEDNWAPSVLLGPH